MMPRLFLRRIFWSPAIVIICLGLTGSQAVAGGKIGVYGFHITPNGADAEDYSDDSWGGGLHAVVLVPQVHNFFAGTIGIEFSQFFTETKIFQDRVTGLRTEQHTSQDYFRFYLGGRAGGHGHGFLRPFAGLNLALVHYSIGTVLVIPDDYDPDREIRQDMGREGRTVFGYDISLGTGLNFYNKVAVEGGVRYMKSFSVLQQLGEGSVRVSPEYFQIYFGIGVSFDLIKKASEQEPLDEG